MKDVPAGTRLDLWSHDSKTFADTRTLTVTSSGLLGNGKAYVAAKAGGVMAGVGEALGLHEPERFILVARHSGVSIDQVVEPSVVHVFITQTKDGSDPKGRAIDADNLRILAWGECALH